MLKRALHILILGLFASPAFAQVYEIGLSDDGVSMPSVVNMSDTYYMDLVIVNKGTTAITDQVEVRIEVRDTADNPIGPSRQLWSISGLTVQPGDSIVIPPTDLYDNVTPSYYVPGDNIVVIWPYIDVTATQTTELHFNSLYVNTTDAVEEVEASIFEVYQIAEHMVVETDLRDFSLFVFDLTGKEVAQLENKRSVSLKALSEGIYIVQLQLEDGTTQSRKLMVNK